ncbi:MAG: DUF1016 N-terminal domain-containing protein [Endomicrobium sp.]|nr:DUF1016 N-terminal domain-containing protein [Endomicrobium sp.]
MRHSKIIAESKNAAARSVDFARVVMYWKLGERIVVEEQKGAKRAQYGAYLLRNLSSMLEPQYGRGFSIRQLERARKFYTLYPIASALQTQLGWYHFAY